MNISTPVIAGIKESIFMDILSKTRQELSEIMAKMTWEDEPVNVVSARTLTANEAIGFPERLDYPILKGKEVMVEAVFRGYKGQAYTDQPGNYSGTLQAIINLPLSSNFERAVFIAASNALLRVLNKVDKTVHCRDQEPAICARRLAEYVHKRFGNPRIAFIGLQPGMVAELSKHYDLRVVDLDVENLGKRFGEVSVEDVSHTDEIINWCDIILATGSTVVNNTLSNFILEKPTIFYGVTIAGIAHLNGFEHYCHCGH